MIISFTQNIVRACSMFYPLFVFTAFRVDVATPPKIQDGLLAPVFASIIIVVVIVLDFLDFSYIIVIVIIVIEVILALSYRNVLGFDIQHRFFARLHE